MASHKAQREIVDVLEEMGVHVVKIVKNKHLKIHVVRGDLKTVIVASLNNGSYHWKDNLRASVRKALAVTQQETRT